MSVRPDHILLTEIERHIRLSDPWCGVSVSSIVEAVGGSRQRIQRLLEESPRFRSVLVSETLPLRYKWRLS